MGRALRTVRGWLSWRNDASAHLVFLVNAGVALVAGLGGVVGGKLSIGWGLAVAAALFAALTGCLLSRRTAMVAAVLGSTLAGLLTGALTSVLLHGDVAGRIGAAVSGVAAFALVFLVYYRLVRATTGAGALEGRYTGTFNARSESLRKGTGPATVIVSHARLDDYDLSVAGVVVAGVPVALFGKRREDETIADLLRVEAEPPFELLRGRAQIDGVTLIVDLEGSPFGSYVFIGTRERC